MLPSKLPYVGTAERRQPLNLSRADAITERRNHRRDNRFACRFMSSFGTPIPPRSC